MKIIKNIYCPKCLELDELNVSLKDLTCPQCNTQYEIKNNKLSIKTRNEQSI